jgi:hypothetical protein
MRVLLYIYACIILIYSQNTVYAQSGNVSSFTKINISGKLNVRLEKSDSNYISVKSKEINIKNIKYSIKNNTLNIKTTKLTKKENAEVTIGFKSITSIKISSGAKAYNYGAIESRHLDIIGKLGSDLDLLIKVDTLNIKVSQDAFVRLRGEAKYANIQTSLGGDIMADDLENRIAKVLLTGGSVYVNTSDFLDANVKNGAELKFKTQPKQIKKKTSFNGKISKAEEL